MNRRLLLILGKQRGTGTPLPPRPTAPTLLADAGSETNPTTEINLTWTKSIDGVMTNYRVYIGGVLQQTFGDVALGTLTGLTVDTLYSNITVRAWDGVRESVNSNSIDVTTEAVPVILAIPTNINVVRDQTPVYTTTTSSLGMVENDEAESLNNANKLVAGLNATADGVTVDGTYFIETPGTSLTATDIRLSSVNSGELKSNEADTWLFTSAGIENIECSGVTFSNVYASGGLFKLFWYWTSSLHSIGKIHFTNNTFNGNINIYRKYTDDATVDPDIHKIDSFIATSNSINNNRTLPVYVRNVGVSYCNIISNTIRNCDNVMFEFGIGNGGAKEDEAYYARPLFTITDNDMRNDVDFECIGVEGAYQSLAVIEGDQVDYLRNHVEGIWTTLDKAVYDAYLSCNIINYKNNTNKNNVAFNLAGTDNNTLIKMKGCALSCVNAIRNVEDNAFVTTESWIDLVVLEGADKQYSHVNFAQTGPTILIPTTTAIKNNTFDIYSLVGKQDFQNAAITYEISGNTFNVELSNGIFTEQIVMTDTNVPNAVVFSDNIFDVTDQNQAETYPAMVKFGDLRTTNTDKVGSIVVDNNSGTVINYQFFYGFDSDYLAVTDNTFVTNPDVVSYPEFMKTVSYVTSDISNSSFTYNTGTFMIGVQEYLTSLGVDEVITFNGIPDTGSNGMRLKKGLASNSDITYRRTLNVDSGQEIFYFEFTLSYDTDHWNVSFTDSGDTPRTYQMNNDDGTSPGHYTNVKVINSGVSNTSTIIRFNNTDGWAGFDQVFIGATPIDLDITTINNL